MVTTLKNAFATDRIAQGYMLTGVRGVGKTTTARIIATGLNCLGPQGQSGPTTEPCGTCEPCLAIADGRHVDVLEMDVRPTADGALPAPGARPHAARARPRAAARLHARPDARPRHAT